MGEAVDAFLAKLRRGEIIGENAVASMALDAVQADAAAARAKGTRPAASLAVRYPAPVDASSMTDDQLYDVLYPSPAEAARRRDAAAAAASAAMSEPMTDDEYDRLFPQPQNQPHDAVSVGAHIHQHPDHAGGFHSHAHGHAGDSNHDHHAQAGS